MTTWPTISLLLKPIAGVILGLVAARAVEKDVQAEDRRRAAGTDKHAPA